jgi:hypothetical protein
VLFDMLSLGELPVVPERLAVPGPEVVPVPPAPIVVLEPLYDVRVVDWQPAASAATSARLNTVRGRTVVWMLMECSFCKRGIARHEDRNPRGGVQQRNVAPRRDQDRSRIACAGALAAGAPRLAPLNCTRYSTSASSSKDLSNTASAPASRAHWRTGSRV